MLFALAVVAAPSPVIPAKAGIHDLYESLPGAPEHGRGSRVYSGILPDSV